MVRYDQEMATRIKDTTKMMLISPVNLKGKDLVIHLYVSVSELLDKTDNYCEGIS